MTGRNRSTESVRPRGGAPIGPAPPGQSGDVATGQRQFGTPVRDRTQPQYVLRLYVAGMRRTSAQALEQVRSICEEHLHGRYELEVIDIYQLPALARGEQIVATPTLIRVLPAPLRRYIGNLSDENILFGLDLRKKC